MKAGEAGLVGMEIWGDAGGDGDAGGEAQVMGMKMRGRQG